MDKLPPTPPKSQPQSSSTPSSSPSSLPPRPPPSQIRPAISILPALPMAHHQKQLRKFPAQGIGRGSGLQGHASLPPKPIIPGKPLPRDTGPIVLTGGKETTGSGSFSYSHAAKRAYPSTTMSKAESPPAARREPVMTELAPAPKSKVATSPIHHHQPPVTPITPPAEAMARPFVDQASSLIDYSLDSKELSIHTGDQTNSPQHTKTELQSHDGNDLAALKTSAEHTYPNTMRSEVVLQPNFFPFPHADFYENIQENGFHPNRNLGPTSSNETPIHNGPLSDGYPPYALPPPLPPHHPPHHMPFHHQGFIPRGPQDPFPFHSSMTPPNTGAMFAPPPLFRPHGAFDNSSQNSERGGSTNPQTPFTPTHPYPVHIDLQHQHHMSIFSPPPHEHAVHIHNSNERHPQEDRGFENALISSQENKTRQTSMIENDPLLRNISFFPTDNDQQYNSIPNGNMMLPVDLSNPGPNMGYHGGMHSAENHNRQLNGFEHSMGHLRKPGFDAIDREDVAAHRLQSYTLGYYLCDRLSDVRLSVDQTGGTCAWSPEEFSAHSFILGRSTKLARLIEDQIKNNEEQALKDSKHSDLSWANEMEMGRKAKTTSSRKITLSLKTSDRYITRDSFLLSLRWLYGGADWELDAYLNPSHPKHRTLEWTRESLEKANRFRQDSPLGCINPSEKESVHQETNNTTGPTSLGNIIQSSKSEEVRMLERSIALLATGTLLGIDEIIAKGIWGIRRWGMRLEGGALERLLDFALHVIEDDNTKTSANDIDEPSIGYGVFARNLLNEAVAFLVRNLPQPFKFDPRAPASKYLIRFPGMPSRSSTGINTPISPQDRVNGPAEARQVYSTILVSVPFSLLRTILEHDAFGVKANNWKEFEKYDIAKAVIHERERRRKHNFKAEKDRRLSICSETNDLGIVDGHISDSSMSPTPPNDKNTGYEALQWEESVLRTFGHGGNGLEITRRKKGVGAAAGGRVLWKVGDSAKV